MNAEDVLRSRSLAVAALVLATMLLAIGVQQAAIRTGDVEIDVLAPLVIALGLSAAIVLGGLVRPGRRRTPYW